MERRTYLRSLGVAGAAGIAGCLDSLSSGDERERADGAILLPPETDLSAASHPSYGDQLPELSLPDPLLDETITTTQFEGDRAVLMTFIYTNCPDGMCPALTLRLRRVQEVAASEGYSDDVALLEMTFDPERDTEEQLRAFADQQGVDAEADNWHFLRPESYDEAKQLMNERIGLPLEKKDPDAEDSDGDEHESTEAESNGNESAADDSDGNESSAEESNEYVFPHYNLILLANENGIVERAYPNGATIDPETVVDDVETVVSE